MKWNKRTEYSAVSECGQYVLAKYVVDGKVLFRASQGGRFVTGALSAARQISKAIKSPN